MSAFPKLSTNALAQYPLERALEYSTVINRFVGGREQRFSEFNDPIRRWVVRLEKLNSAELGVFEDFFAAHDGTYGSFSFTDPFDDVDYPDCSFEDNDFVAMYVEEERAELTLTVRVNRE